MRRSLVHFFWGEQYLHEAVRSALDSIEVGLPRIAITDRETAALIAADAPFDEVVVAEMPRRSLLAKADFYRYLPRAYDSFLFLDTDAIVIGDVRYGFEKAESHGIAGSMAPHYGLDVFWGFDRILREVGVPCASQLQYNTGVIFFSRRADVDQVMQKWSELTSSLGVEAPYHSDQPFFTLAMEMIGFNPYTLSPAYNYRALGELASGPIRVWHSHEPLPANVNTFNTVWPVRRFHGSTLARY